MTARFYFDVSSPYAYLAAHRVDDVVPGEVEWCPIAFGPLLVALGRVPWSMTPGEREPGQRECERRAAERGLPPIEWPEGWPSESYSVNGPRAVLAAKRRGEERRMALALFDQAFVHGRRMDDPTTIAEAARTAGLPGLEDELAEVKDELRAATDEARARGVTGIPTVEVGGTLFWGDDRLEEAARAAA